MKNEAKTNELPGPAEQFQAIFHEFPDVILVIDGASGQILQANRAVYRILGYESAALIGKHVATLCLSPLELPLED